MPNKGYKRPEWVRKKISESKKGIPASERTKQRASETHKGKTVSAETRAKMSAAKTNPVVCTNIETNEVKYFDSLSECAAFFGLDKQWVGVKCRQNGVLRGWRISRQS